jgi:hypothetical protein
MLINFNEYGYAWPNTSTVTNHLGIPMSITPEYVRSGYQVDMNDRLKECYRIYSTPLGLMSELEIKYWQIGGEHIASELIDAYRDVFKERGKSEMGIVDVLDSLEKRNSDVIQIQTVVGWLIKGRLVDFDPEKMIVSDIKGKTRFS